MLKFVVVDDDKGELDYISRLLDDIVKQDKKILTFTKIDATLKKEINNTEDRKIYILDIELGHGVSGINIAKLIRNVDWESEIIFITNHDKMFEYAHRSVYEIFDFIEKFQDFEKRFKKDIKDIIKRNFDNKMLVYKSSNVELSLFYKSILYIYRETEDRKLVVVADNNKYMLNMNIKDIFAYLDDRFVQCHRSCIVNNNRVHEKNYKEGYFTLDTGEKVYMLSKKYKKRLEND